MKPKHEADFDAAIEALVRGSALKVINRSDLGAIDEGDFEAALYDETLRGLNCGEAYPVSEDAMLRAIGAMVEENGLGSWWTKIRDTVVGGVKKVAKVVTKVAKVAIPVAVGAGALLLGGPPLAAGAMKVVSGAGKLISGIMGGRGGKSPEQVQQVVQTYPVQVPPGATTPGGAQIGSPKFFDVAKQYAMQIMGKNNVNMASPAAQQIMDQRLRQEIDAARMAQAGTLPRSMYAAGSPPPPPSGLPKWLLPGAAGLLALKFLG